VEKLKVLKQAKEAIRARASAQEGKMMNGIKIPTPPKGTKRMRRNQGRCHVSGI